MATKPKAKKPAKPKYTIATRVAPPRKLKPQYVGKKVPAPWVALPPRDPNRPVHFSQTVKDSVLNRISGGETLVGICREVDYPDARTVQGWVLRDEKFRVAYNEAVKMRCEVWSEKLKETGSIPLIGSKTIETIGGKDGPTIKTETYDAVDRAKLDSDNTKWLLARLDRDRFGDKLTTENTNHTTMDMRVTTVKVVIVDPQKKTIEHRGS